MPNSPDLRQMRQEVPGWHEHAACRQRPELLNSWHDARPGSSEAEACRQVCAECPVRLSCALDALQRGEPWGMWGGLDRKDRKAIALSGQFPVPAMVPAHGTDARYKKNGCRCRPCKDAHALYEAMRRERHRAQEPAATTEAATPVAV